MIASNKSLPGLKEIHREGFVNRAGLAVGDKFIIYAAGNNVIIDSLSNSVPLQLKGHDNVVNCISLSNNLFVASGQLAAPGSPNYDSPVLLWKTNSSEYVGRLFGLKQGVKQLAFSSDCRFLGGVSCKDQLIIWDIKSQNQIYNKNFQNPISILNFSQENIIILSGKILQNIQLNPLLSQNKPPIFSNLTLPSTGLPRIYSCLVETAPTFQIIGTQSGQLCIFSKGVFKSSIIIGKGKVSSICTPNNKDIYAVVGNQIAKYQLANQQLKQKARVAVDRAKIVKSNKQGQLFVMSQDSIYRLSNDLKIECIKVSHISKIHQVSQKNGIISSIDQQGCIISRSYKNGKIGVVNIWRSPKYTKGRCIQVAHNGNILAGFADGNLVCLSPDCKNLLWQISAHKGPVTTIFSGESYILTGGDDCVVRIWSSSKQLINQLSTHQKTVSKVFGDVLSPNIIYSSSLDRSIQAYDLKNDKKLYFKQVNNGNITDMIQQPKSGDLITCGFGTAVSFWKSADYQPYRNIQPHSGSAIILAINQNGSVLCLGCDDGQIAIHNLKLNKEVGNIIAHSRQITGMQWINQSVFVSVSQDQSIAFWNFQQI